MNVLARVAILAGAGLGLSGCFSDEYYARRDSVTRGVGDAVQVNQVTQTVDAWPEHAKNSAIEMDGKRAALATQRYQQNRVVQPRGLATTTVTEQAGPGAQATTALQK